MSAKMAVVGRFFFRIYNKNTIKIVSETYTYKFLTDSMLVNSSVSESLSIHLLFRFSKTHLRKSISSE